jgi:prepilin-type N-terminal cleavage/methylation domain-containing protein
MKKAFTLIELLVVIGVIGLLLAVMAPSLLRAREQSRVVAVNSDLYQIGLSLEMYMDDNRGHHPPTRQDCFMGWEDHQLPPELAEGGYLPAASASSEMTARIEDRFHRGHTYKYWSVGELYQNNRFMETIRASLLIPAGFPGNEGEPQEDIEYDDPDKSPVTWVIFSQGPNYDDWETLKILNGPVPKRTWYSPATRSGLIVRMRLRNGRQIGTFEE